MLLKSLFLRRKAALALAAALALGTAMPAQAFLGGGRIVFDPSNYSQNVLTAARTLEQINNQIKQLQNQARNLASLDHSALGELRAAMAATNELIRQAQGLAFDVAHMDARERWQQSLEALRTATQVQSQAVRSFASDERTLTDLVNRSQSAVGALQAMQATNQLLALQSRQAMQAQQLQITQDRAAALEQARQVAVQERAREVRRRFQSEGTPYTPVAVGFYGQ